MLSKKNEPKRKKVRTISGVSIISVMTKPLPCPGKCIYCPGGFDKENPSPKSYMPKSPVVLRAIRNDYDPRKQVDARIEALKKIGHITDKNEIIVMGGTFMAFPKEYRIEFIKGIYDGLNGTISEDLEESKKLNESAEHRCVGLCIETRPDWCNEEQIREMLEYGVTRVEIGVQIPDNMSYKVTDRGHTVEDVIQATKLLKDSGIKVYYHYMCNLPGATIESDIKNFKKLFLDPNFRSDGVKIYPCVVVKGAKLEKIFNEGRYKPYTDNEIIDLIIKLKQMVPRYVRIPRIMRDLPAEYIVGSTKYSHFRNAAHEKMNKLGVRCQCTRCREVGHVLLKGKKIDEKNIKLNKLEYDASDGKEIFLTFDDMKNDALIGLLRLRVPSKPFRKEITKQSTLVRELHVYGVEMGLKNEAQWTKSFQHKGFGKKLLEEAEKITKEIGFKKILVISAVGVRKYYEKLGYRLEGPYMVKDV
jgi:elongator complex protein 3